MRKSRFTNQQKLDILKEKTLLGISAEELCANHKISIATYYNWKNKLQNRLDNERHVEDPVLVPPSLVEENQTLRHLYMDLSQHNYQLSKFLKIN